MKKNLIITSKTAYLLAKMSGPDVYNFGRNRFLGAVGEIYLNVTLYM